MARIQWQKIIFIVLVIMVLAACQSADEEPDSVAENTAEPTTVVIPPTPTASLTPTDLPAPVILPSRTHTPAPTATPVPTETPLPTATETSEPTPTPEPTDPPAPTSPPQPVNTPTSAPPPGPTAPPSPPQDAPNLLPNPSFEQGYTNLYNAPELQVPVGWQMQIDENGPTAPETGELYLRPESRIAPRWGIPPNEIPLFVYHGDWTLKVFKGGAPISFSLFTDVHLEPGSYRFVANYFPDIVAHYNSDGTKAWAPQTLAGEVNFINGGLTGWTPMQVGVKNTMVQNFTVETAGSVRIGVGWRARYIQGNNGLFIDHWVLQKVG